MIILSCNEISKTFGTDVVLSNVSFSIEEKNKIGVVGVNGAGKSTLFKIIVGDYSPDNGQIYISKDAVIGYLPQNASVDSRKTIWEELLEVFSSLIDMEKEIRKLEEEMTNYENMSDEEYQKLMDDYSNLSEVFQSKGGYSYQSYIKGILTGLGFSAEQYEQPIWQLSGGQKTRIALAKLLLSKPDLLLLDEPTNHLDLEATQWLEDYLKEYPGAIMIISHDRYFLDNACTDILEIENTKAYMYSGNYSVYRDKKQSQVQNKQKEYEIQQKEIKRQQAIIERYRSYNREKSIRAAESRQKMLDKIEPVDKPFEQESIYVSFRIKKQSGQRVLDVDNLSKQFDEVLFENVSFSLFRGERIAIIGPNGVGKSTLLKIILDIMPPTEGTIKLGSGISIGYYDQEQASLDPKKTVIDEIWSSFTDLTQTQIRNALAAFLFKGDDVFKTIDTLSGGERGRVLITKLMLAEDNFLVLDEPTNHLDLDSKERLEEALIDYPGTILAVSHDRYFLNKIADKILVLNKDGIIEYLGNYEYYIEKKKALSSSQNDEENNATKSKTAANQDRKRQRQEKQKQTEYREKLKSIEDTIEELENTITELEALMCKPELYSDVDKMKEIQQKYSQAKDDLENAYGQWLLVIDD